MNDTSVYEIVTPSVDFGMAVAVWTVVGSVLIVIGIYYACIGIKRDTERIFSILRTTAALLITLGIGGIVLPMANIAYRVEAAVNQNIVQQIEKDIGLTDITPVNGTDYKGSFIAKDSDGNVVKGKLVELDEPNHYLVRLSDY